MSVHIGTAVYFIRGASLYIVGPTRPSVHMDDHILYGRPYMRDLIWATMGDRIWDTLYGRPYILCEVDSQSVYVGSLLCGRPMFVWVRLSVGSSKATVTLVLP